MTTMESTYTLLRVAKAAETLKLQKRLSQVSYSWAFSPRARPVGKLRGGGLILPVGIRAMSVAGPRHLE